MSLSPYALITLQDAKEHLTIVGADSDPVIEGLVNTATEAIEEFCGERELVTREALEVHDGDGSNELQLRQYPVTDVSLVEFWDGTAWLPYDPDDYGLYIVEPVLDTIGFRNLCFPRGRQNVRVTRTAGFTATPSKLKEACRQAVLSIWKQKDRQIADIAAMSIPGGQAVTYGKDDLPAQTKMLLKGYVRWENT